MAKAAARAQLRYFSAWFCPFAHRATLALEHHAHEVGYEWEEALGWERRPSGDANAREQGGEPSHENWYHYKSPELLAANPAGMVPTLVDQAGNVVTESLVTIQYVDDLAKAQARLRGFAGPERTTLMPGDPAGDARARVAMDWVHKRLCAPYYTMLVRTDPAERLAAFDALKGDLAQFAEKRRGTFYCGDTIGAVDLALLPWAARFYVLEHYRGFHIPDEGPLQGYHEWLRAALALDYVEKTLPDRERYLEHIGRYADASARSKVANAVRSGRTADAYDDRLDG